MWQALLTVCFIDAMSQCITLESQKWHMTERQCKNDAFQMAEKIHFYMKSHKPVRYDCRKLKAGMLTK